MGTQVKKKRCLPLHTIEGVGFGVCIFLLSLPLCLRHGKCLHSHLSCTTARDGTRWEKKKILENGQLSELWFTEGKRHSVRPYDRSDGRTYGAIRCEIRLVQSE